MSLRTYVRDNDGTITEITRRIRIGTSQYSASASEGSVGSCSIPVEDPLGTFAVRGHRLWYARETEALGDPYGGVVWVGYTFNRKYARGTYTRGRGRLVTVQLNDINTLLSRKINFGNDCDRPDEHEIDRVEWLLGTSEMTPIEDDSTYVANTDGWDMDENDYTGQSVLDVLDDCSQQSGRNYYAFQITDPTTFRLWYNHGTGALRTSDIRISNVLSDLDEDTFPPSRLSELDRDPSRVYSHVWQQYDGGGVMVRKDATVTKFANRQTPGRAENVKRRTTAEKRARRYLNEIDSELDTFSAAIIVPAARVNAVMQGERVAVRISHFPGYEDDFVWMRVRDRTVRDLTPEEGARLLNVPDPVTGLYEIALNLVTPEPEDTGGGGGESSAVLYYGHGPFASGLVRFEGTGTNPPPGWPGRPMVGPFTYLSDSHQRPYTGIQVDGTGTVDVRLKLSAAGVGDSVTFTFDITLNGSVVASEDVSVDKPGSLDYLAGAATVTVTGLAVSPGDVIGARASALPLIPFFTVPMGTGTGDEQLEIIGGSVS